MTTWAYDECCLCGHEIRPHNGRIQRFEYKVEMGGVHKLGGRVVLTKRRNVLRIWGCKPCYDKLPPPPVRTLLYNLKSVIWAPIVLIFSRIVIICLQYFANFGKFDLFPFAYSLRKRTLHRGKGQFLLRS